MLHDRRITAWRPDRAAAHLRGRVEADVFVEGEVATVTVALAPLRREPRLDCALDTEALRGERVTVYERNDEGWAWVQFARDGYVGWMSSDALGPEAEATHRVFALRTLVFPGPNLKLPVCGALPLGSRVPVSKVADGYAAVPEGFLSVRHLAPGDTAEADFLAIAERFLGVPYLWGGKSSLGLDCSGLVQVALDACGVPAPRDSDLQEAKLGAPLAHDAALRRGDLVFWKGHVGLMRDAETLLHANAHAMMVSSEPLAQARERIRAATGSDVTSVRRL